MQLLLESLARFTVAHPRPAAGRRGDVVSFDDRARRYHVALQPAESSVGNKEGNAAGKPTVLALQPVHPPAAPAPPMRMRGGGTPLRNVWRLFLCGGDTQGNVVLPPGTCVVLHGLTSVRYRRLLQQTVIYTHDTFPYIFFALISPLPI